MGIVITGKCRGRVKVVMVEKMGKGVKIVLQFRQGHAIMKSAEICPRQRRGRGPARAEPVRQAPDHTFIRPSGGVHKPFRAAAREDRGAL